MDFQKNRATKNLEMKLKSAHIWRQTHSLAIYRFWFPQSSTGPTFHRFDIFLGPVGAFF